MDPTNTSRGSGAFGTQASRSPAGVSDGRSLAEWTAASARPSSTAELHLLDEGPLAPDPIQGELAVAIAPRRDHHGLDLDRPGRPWSSSATMRGLAQREAGAPCCQRGAPTGASTVGQTRRGSEVEEQAERLDQPLPPWRARRLLERHGRVVHQLGQHRAGDGVDVRPLLVGEVAELATATLELGGAQALEPIPQGGDDRGGAPGPRRTRYRATSSWTMSWASATSLCRSAMA